MQNFYGSCEKYSESTYYYRGAKHKLLMLFHSIQLHKGKIKAMSIEEGEAATAVPSYLYCYENKNNSFLEGKRPPKAK